MAWECLGNLHSDERKFNAAYGGGKKTNPAFLSIYCYKYVPSANLSTPHQLHPAAIHHAVEGTLAACHPHAKGKPLPCKYRQVLWLVKSPGRGPHPCHPWRLAPGECWRAAGEPTADPCGRKPSVAQLLTSLTFTCSFSGSAHPLKSYKREENALYCLL